MKKITALLLTAILIISAVPVFAATTFTDINEVPWAKEYILDMTDRGLFTGYNDGTFKPSNMINMVEVLALLSRVCNESTQVKDLVLADYQAYLSVLLAGKNLSWAYDEIAICLEAGIITKAELAASVGSITGAITKETFSKYLARAMQLEEQAAKLANYTLDFEDRLTIAVDKRPYVYLLVENGIVTGTTDNKFQPQSNVNRAVSATMLSRALDYMETNNIQLLLPKYSTVQTHGVLEDVQSGTILVRGYNGIVESYKLPSSYTVYINGVAGVLLNTYGGSLVTLTWSKITGAITSVNIDTKTGVKQGIMKSMSVQTFPEKIYITDLEDGVITGYDLLSTGTVVTYGDESTTTTKLNAGTFITLIFKDGKVSEIKSYSGSFELTGKIQSVTLGKPIVITVSESSNKTVLLHLDPAALPTVKRGGNTTTVDKLRTDDTIKVTYKSGFISSVDVDVLTANKTGTVTRIVKDITGTIITVKDATLVETSYQLASGAAITKNGIKATFDDLAVGSAVSLVVSDNAITAIDVSPKVAATGTVSGSILFLNSTDNSFILEVTRANGTKEQVTVQVKGYNTKFLSAADGSSIAFRDLAIFDVVDVYGTNTGVQFEATIIIKR